MTTPNAEPTKAERDEWRQGYGYYNRGSKPEAKRVLRLIRQVDRLEAEVERLLVRERMAQNARRAAGCRHD